MDYRKIAVVALAAAILIVVAVRRPSPSGGRRQRERQRGPQVGRRAHIRSRRRAVCRRFDGRRDRRDRHQRQDAGADDGGRQRPGHRHRKSRRWSASMPDQILINDVAVNPISKNVYVVGRARPRPGRACRSSCKVEPSGKLTLLPLDNIRHASVSLTDAPATTPTGASESADADDHRHGVHQRQPAWSPACRTRSGSRRCARFRIRSRTPPRARSCRSGTRRTAATRRRRRCAPSCRTRSAAQQYVLAAYTCTPLVKIPVSDLKPGAQVKGVTIADLGSGNQPLDMVPYKKDGHEFILIANTSFGVVKLHADNLGTDKPIDSPTVVRRGRRAVRQDRGGDQRAAPRAVRSTRARRADVRGRRRLRPGHRPFNLQTIALP